VFRVVCVLCLFTAMLASLLLDLTACYHLWARMCAVRSSKVEKGG